MKEVKNYTFWRANRFLPEYILYMLLVYRVYKKNDSKYFNCDISETMHYY
jgi:hypothetical protein